MARAHNWMILIWSMSGPLPGPLSGDHGPARNSYRTMYIAASVHCRSAFLGTTHANRILA